MPEPTISAVICTRNRPDLIGGAVQSVLANSDTNFELIVIDQSDTNATREALSPVIDDPRLRYVHTTRVGLSSAYNSGVALGRGELFAFTDDDCLAPRDWLTCIRREFAEEADVDLVYGEVVAPPHLSRLPGVVPALIFPMRRRLSAQDGFLVAGMGANFAVRKRAFLTAGLFDEVLGGGGPLRSSQDYDFQFRLFRASGVSVLSPNVRVTHLGHRTPGEWSKTSLAYGVGDGAFYMKHLRCGDLLAGRMLLTRVAREAAKAALFPIVRHHRHSTTYLSGLIRGSCNSFRFSIDRRQRLYVAR
ncbi:MAG: glycosyltransferase [Tepidiformaceae bacterium]